MKYRTGLTLILFSACILLSSFPAFAGEWQMTEEDQWKYIQSDGSVATGWQDIDGNRYYFDEDGNRKSDYWHKDDGNWYYLDEDGVMATDTWVDNYYVNEEGVFEKKR